MSNSNKFLEDASRVFSGAMGVAQSARTEAETAMKSFVDRWMNDRDFVTREEFDAVKEMATNARKEVEALKSEVAALKAEIEGDTKK